MQGLSGIFVRNLMTASMISWHSKQSLGTAMCLQYGQETMSTFLWGVGAIIWGGHIKLSKREECREVNYPKLILGALRKLVLSGVSDKLNRLEYISHHRACCRSFYSRGRNETEISSTSSCARLQMDCFWKREEERSQGISWSKDITCCRRIEATRSFRGRTRTHA